MGSSREGKGLGAAPWGADLSPLCFSQPCLSSGTRVCSGQALLPLHNQHFCRFASREAGAQPEI